jgi:hypothetical protein
MGKLKILILVFRAFDASFTLELRLQAALEKCTFPKTSILKTGGGCNKN